MKKVALITLSVVSLVSVGAAYLYQPQSSHLIKAKSQQDTTVDLSSQKDFFEYSLSSLGEQDLEAIKATVNAGELQKNALGISSELFDTYLAYKEALSKLEPFEGGSLSLQELKRLDDAILAMQRTFFTDEQIAQLFDEENRLRQLAIDKLAIQAAKLDANTHQQMLEETLAAQPEYIQQSERNNALVLQLNQASGMDAQEKYLTRVDLVGEEGAQRLQALDDKRAAFNTSLNDYLKKRAEILNNDFLGKEEKKLEIAGLREQSFEEKQWRRIEALERIHDSEQR
ncbi:MAG: lipase secretion chaperone [Pseudomonadota bacterium]|uniref:lipase secretion chaperone n=1 Tax=Vibrio TaxID=662 RepID=UPI00097FAF71|nr:MULTISPECIES: lipase secretion chaperone [Vibrio]AQM67296.1 lipase chaperone [Vibrio campbellii]MCC4222320.1 lipase secretion chaperone [Vibrio campbellii]MDK9755343.1 lipase secretion chaperone [Vibrio sp. D173a]PQJ47983.1 lipase chaperone [Vibrio campbellii]